MKKIFKFIYRFIEKIDFLWKGDADSLITMWLAILLALSCLLELGLNIYIAFNKHKL